MKRMGKWLHAVHAHCTATKTAENPDGAGLTIEEIVRRFGDPPGRSHARNVMRLAKAAGHFKTVRRRTGYGQRHRWFVAVYFATGPTPPLRVVKPKNKSPSQFDGITRANSIFDLATQLSKT